MNCLIYVCNLIAKNFINSIDVEIINDDIIKNLKNNQIDEIVRNTKILKVIKTIF